MSTDAKLETMEEKLKLIESIFAGNALNEESAPDAIDEAMVKQSGVSLQHGNFYGGVVNGRKFMYSTQLIEGLTLERLEKLIRNQTGLILPPKMGKQVEKQPRIKKTKPV